MKALKTLLFGLLFFVLITFPLKNTENVPFRYFGLVDSFEIPLFLLVLLSVFSGMLIGAVMDLIVRHRLKKAIRREERIREKHEEDLVALRNAVLAPSKGDTDEEGREPGDEPE